MYTYMYTYIGMGFPSVSVVKSLSAKQGTQIWSLNLGDPLEEEIATHFNILAQEIPWTEEPDGLQSMRLQRVGHDLATKQQQKHIWSGLFAFILFV